ncbi:hypothetical protein BdWA1_001899 [Babesia duncani]|uniref:Uncharacterized protein n=1 Tax=Babesia duncani TaxID=323732 RepID=A0AAD9PL20_9APIC|nr:hypothetical protein BdWA1_001899 [Babesia duncani]
MVNLSIQNFCNGTTPSKLTFSNVNNDSKISEIKAKIYRKLQDCMDTELLESKACSYYALYIGTILLEDDDIISNHNESNLTLLTLSLYQKQVINIVVKVMPCTKLCGFFYTPLHRKLMPKKLSFEMIDQETVLSLKRHICICLGDYYNKQGYIVVVATNSNI